MIDFLKSALNIRESKRQRLIILLICFLVAFALAHAYSVYTGRSLYIEGYQIHHFYFGMLCSLVGGIIALLNRDTKALQAASGLIGVGLGLFADEIGLLLNCTTNNHFCAYAFPDSFDFIGTIALIIFLFILMIELFDRYKRRKAGQKIDAAEMEDF